MSSRIESGARSSERRRRPARRLLVLAVALSGAFVAAGAAAPVAGATAITSPGGGESFSINPGDNMRVGYDFTIPGNNRAITVKWSHPQAVVSFTCKNGTAGSFTIAMPDYTATVSDSQWYPSGDQSSSLVYQGSVSAPNGCGDGTAMKMTHQAAFSADVTTSAAVSLHYRFHNSDNTSGSWSSTESVTPGPISQTIQSEIYQCASGSPTSTLVSGGSISVPAASLSSSNPLPATSVSADSYAVNASAPAGFQFVACGQSGVTIGTPDSASQSVTVPAGGAGDGKFYVTQIPVITQTIQSEIYLCSKSAPTTTLAPGGSITVPAASLTSANPLPATAVAAADYTVNAAAPSGYQFVKCGQTNVKIQSAGAANQTVTVPAGGAGDGRFYVSKIPASQTIQAEIYFCNKGVPTTELTSGGSIMVPAAGLSSANPLAPTAVGAATYTVKAVAPNGEQFVACGQSGVTITDQGHASRSVTVPSGGAGDGKFYVTIISS